MQLGHYVVYSNQYSSLNHVQTTLSHILGLHREEKLFTVYVVLFWFRASVQKWITQ